MARGEAAERGDFLTRQYEARLRRNPNRMQVQLAAQGTAGDLPVRITKGVTLEAGSSTPGDRLSARRAASRASRCISPSSSISPACPRAPTTASFTARAGSGWDSWARSSICDDAVELGLVDEWLGIDVSLEISRPSGIWTFPVETVSQSEGGFELVHQSVVVQPHWIVQPDADGRWSVTIRLTLDTTLAESRMESSAVAVST